MKSSDIISALSLQPHPEGGWYREFYRSSDTITGARGRRPCVTSIYYLLEQRQISRWHVVEADEIWHFYGGAPLDLYAYEAQSKALTRHLLRQTAPAAAIPRGVWQAARSSGTYSLMGCSVAPGFEFADFSFVSDLSNHRVHFAAELRELANLL